MTQTIEAPKTSSPEQDQGSDRPRRKRSVPRSTVIETAGSAVAATALVWFCFTIAGITGPLGFAFCVLVAFVVIYGLICWQLYGVLAMKDRLATVAIWSGAIAAFIPLAAVILYVFIKGVTVVLARFPHFFIADMTGLTANSPVTAVGAGAAIVGTIEQVGICHSDHRPPWRAHGHVPGQQQEHVREARQHGRRCHDRLSGHHRRTLHLPPLGRTAEAERPDRVRRGTLTGGDDAADRHPRLPRGHRHRSGIPQGGRICARIPPVALHAQGRAPDGPGGTDHGHDPGNRPRGRGDRSSPLHRRRECPLQLEPVQWEAGRPAPRVYELIFQSGVNINRDAWGVAFVLVLVVVTLFVLARLIGAKKPGPSGFTVPWRTRRSPEEEGASA